MPTRINLYLWGAVREWVSGQADCKKTASEYASSRCIVWGAEMRPMLVFPISVLCCVALFPAKSMVPPYSASLHWLRHPMFEFVLFLIFVFSLHDYCYLFYPVISAFPPVSVSSLPHRLDIEMLVWFFELCVAAFFFSFLFFLPSVWSCAVLLLVHHMDIA